MNKNCNTHEEKIEKIEFNLKREISESLSDCLFACLKAALAYEEINEKERALHYYSRALNALKKSLKQEELNDSVFLDKNSHFSYLIHCYQRFLLSYQKLWTNDVNTLESSDSFDLKKFFSSLDLAIEKNPKDVDLINTRGNLLYTIEGDKKAAEADLKKSKELIGKSLNRKVSFKVSQDNNINISNSDSPVIAIGSKKTKTKVKTKK